VAVITAGIERQGKFNMVATRRCGKFPHSANGKGLDLAERIEQSEGALTAQELAVLLNVTASYVLKRAKAGKIPSYRFGGVKFDPCLTAAWLRKCLTS
jgi:excisionase family DNA binding protein